MSTSSETHPAGGMMSHGPAAHEHVRVDVDPETGHVHPHVVTKTPQEVTHDFIQANARMGSGYRTALMVTGGLLVLGVIGFVRRASVAGFTTFSPWAYLMATYAFLVCTASSAPMLAIGQRMLRSHWR